MIGICRLCNCEADLQESHVIPAFVYKWRKDTAPTPHMRVSNEPNRRVQDGLKFFWLCRNCEQRLSNWEREFSRTVFHQVTEDGVCRVQYGDWLLKFCVSISWRVLLSAYEKNAFIELSKVDQVEATAALERLASFLRGEVPHPERFEQHLFVTENLAAVRGHRLPAGMNRYAMRSIEIDVPSTNDFGFTFAKMGPVAVLGFYHLARPREWSGGKVHVKRGLIAPTRYTVPDPFIDYLIRRAVRYGDILNQLSERQRAIADEATTKGIERNRERLADSHWLKGMQRDLDQFGEDALGVGFPKDEGNKANEPKA
jgi:hypothetical protein